MFRKSAFAAILIALTSVSVVRAETAPATQPVAVTALKSSDFIRVIESANGSHLDTADVAFRNADGVTVHLVAAVHVGEASYYEALNNSFKLREAVLYEMVKPKDAGVPEPGQPSQSMIGQVQHMMKDVLGLDFQLDDVNYSAPNFVHADLDAETFEKMQDERGEGFTQMFMQQLMKAFSQPHEESKEADDQGEAQLEEMVRMFTRPDGERQMKQRFAKQLADMEGSPMGPDALQGSVLLTERNKAAFAVLDKTIASGKKDIAIFYGAAHMPDMATRLASLGFKPLATEWRTAWDLTIRADQPSEIEKLLINAIRDLSDDKN